MHGESESAELDAGSGRPVTALEARTERALAASLRVTMIPVVFLLLGGLGAFAYGVAIFIDSFESIVSHPFPVGHRALQAVHQAYP